MLLVVFIESKLAEVVLDFAGVVLPDILWFIIFLASRLPSS